VRESEENIAQNLSKLPILICSSLADQELKSPVKNQTPILRAILTIFCALLAGSFINLY